MIKRLNLAWIIAGVSIHLMIAFVMGLLPFGIFMMINYVLFVDVTMIKKLSFIMTNLSLYLEERSREVNGQFSEIVFEKGKLKKFLDREINICWHHVQK